jgi:sulfur carrier protein
VRLNGKVTTTTAPTLAALLAEQGFAGVKVATAVNGLFVPERERAAHTVADGDEVEIVSARQGG